MVYTSGTFVVVVGSMADDHALDVAARLGSGVGAGAEVSAELELTLVVKGTM